MANIVVTSTTNTIRVDFGIYADAANGKSSIYSKRSLQRINIPPANNVVQIKVQEAGWYSVCITPQDGAMVVDSVDGVVPTNIADLAAKIEALMI